MLSEDEYVSSDEDAGAVVHDACVEDAEEWQDYHSEFLVTLWHQLVDEVASMGVYVLDKCNFPAFAQFCFENSSGRKPPC